MKNRNIGVLMGGMSTEKNVSIASGEAVLDALLEREYNAVGIFVDRDLDLALRQHEIDVAFLALHGRYGEDGCIQGMLELMGIPYTGCDVLASALAMNKAKSKELFRLHNLATPESYVLHASQMHEVETLHGTLGFPVVVKPLAEGSSVGVRWVDCFEDLRDACENALRFDNQILVEEYIEGQEVAVAIVEDRALGAIEITTSSKLFDYAAKYDACNNAYYIPPRVTPVQYTSLLEQAALAHEALGCSGATRVDMIVPRNGKAMILEVNSIPGFTPTSLLPKIAHSAGLSFQDLVEAILGGASLSTVKRGERDRRVRKRPYQHSERREFNHSATH